MSVGQREGNWEGRGGFDSLVVCCWWLGGVLYAVMMGLGRIDIGVGSLGFGTSKT